MAKSNSDPPPPPDGWRGPADFAQGFGTQGLGAQGLGAQGFGTQGLGAHGLNGVPFSAIHGGGARFDWAAGSGAQVRTFHVTGPAAWALALVVMALVAMFFVFVIGVGSAVALGAGAVAALGIGGRAVRRRLTGGHRQLGSGQQ